MAQRRMFSKTITNNDNFIEMPDSSQNLYFHLSMNADDDGFIDNWKSIMRMTGHKEDDLKILIAKQFVIPFETGVIVIKHWKIHNYLRNDRYKETIHLEEKSKLTIDKSGIYQQKEGFGIPVGIPLVDAGKDSIGNNIYGQNDQKEEVKIYEEQFEQFYKSYPKKVKKQDVKKWFIKHKPSNELFNDIMTSLEVFKNDKDWLKDDGQYIPYPTTWLNQQRWEEKIDELQKNDKPKEAEEYYVEAEALTNEEYIQLMKKEITIQELIEKGKLKHV